MSNSECKVEIKNYIQSFKQEMINNVFDEMKKEGENNNENNMELIKLINNLSDEYIISAALDLALNSNSFFEVVTHKLNYAMENEMPF